LTESLYISGFKQNYSNIRPVIFGLHDRIPVFVDSIWNAYCSPDFFVISQGGRGMWQKFVVLALLLGWVDKGLSAATLTFAAAEFVPFVSVKDGQPSGAVTDIVRQACREAQIECSFKVQAWKDSKAEVEAGKLDGLFVVSWERDRAQ
jgi:hypothetical protein